MKIFVILIAKFIYFVGRIFHRGSSLPGKVALKLDKNILTKIKLPEDIIMVTGSNGKTSTTEMIYHIFKENGYKVGCNIEGSNQTEGVTTLILNSCTLTGKVKKDVLVIESDERYLIRTAKFIKPKYLVITNLYRDQMTRNGHPELIYNIIKHTITDDVHLVLNTDDPLSSLYGYKRENVTYIGINRNEMDTENQTSVYNDAKYCPNCKHILEYEYYHFAHVGSYKCPECGHKRKEPDFAITNIDLQSGEIEINNKHKMQMNLKSLYNAYNSLAAFAVTAIVGVDEEKITKTLNEYTIKNDRVQTFNIDGKNGMLLTSKHENSISYDQSLQYIVKEDKPCTVVIIIDAVSRKYFTSETSWIWDIDFELLKAENIKKIVIAGKYVYDLKIRLKYANIDRNKIIATENLDEMMKVVKQTENENIYIVTCFSDRMKFINRI